MALWVVTDVRLDCDMAPKMVPIAIFYSVVNFAASKYRGRALYPFLTWEDYTSPLLCVGITLFFCTLFWLVANMSHMWKPRMQFKRKASKKTQ